MDGWAGRIDRWIVEWKEMGRLNKRIWGKYRMDKD